MATTRSFTSLGVWAQDADTTIPVSPITGTPYRDTTVTAGQNEAGEAYDTPPNSATFNQRLFIISSFTDVTNVHGIVGWSDEVDYILPAIVWGSDNVFYIAIQPSGPGSTIRDPSGGANPTFWELVGASIQTHLDDFELALADETASTEGTRLVGHTGQTAFQAIEDRTTIASLAASTGASLVNTATTGLSVQDHMPHAWVRFDGAGGIVGTSYNVASVTNPGAGEYVITLTTPLSNLNFRYNVTCMDQASPDTVMSVNFPDSTAAAVIVNSWDTGNGQDQNSNGGGCLELYDNV